MAEQKTAITDEEVHNIVVLGASFAGLGITHKLMQKIIPTLPHSKSFRITLVTESTHFLYTVGTPRTMMGGPKFPLSTTLIPIEHGLKQYSSPALTIIYGTATYLEPSNRAVTITRRDTAAPELISYDTLVITTGAISKSALWSLKDGHQQTADALIDLQARLPSAKSVLLVGGGPVGVESAGEIAFRYGVDKVDAKQITLISGADRLLVNSLRPAIGQQAQRYLEAMGVKVRHGLKIESTKIGKDGTTTVRFSDGTSTNVDVFIDCTGRTPNTSFVPAEMLDSRKKIIVDEYLRVKGAGERVYAFGDAASLSKGGALDIQFSLPSLMASMEHDLGGHAQPKPYVPSDKEMQLVPVGPKKGVGAAFGWKLPSWVVWLIKSRTFFLDKAEKTVLGTA